MKHWTEQDFLHWLYTGPGADDTGADARHLEECAACGERAAQLINTRRRTAAVPEVSWELLAAQRRAIYRRLGGVDSHSFAMRWAVAAVSLLSIAALSLALIRPWTGNSDLYTKADERLFSDLANIEQSSEPRAIRPIQNLFKE